jgi:hypothetical protein
MDDEMKQLEEELRALEPAGPSHDLAARIERGIGLKPASKRSVVPGWWIALPAAAAIALVWTQLPAPPSHVGIRPETVERDPAQRAAAALVPAADPLKPVTAENVLISATDEGLVTLDDGTRARRERLQYVDTITWKNTRTNASLTWRVPREEVRVVPIAFQ